MKTIYSTKEYKFLDSRIKKYLPNYSLAVFYSATYNNLQLMVVPRYSGQSMQVVDPEFTIKKPIYVFNAGHVIDCYTCENIDSRLYWLCKGLNYGGRDILMYFHNNELFKYSIDIFEELFKVAVCKFHSRDLSEIRLRPYKMEDRKNRPFISDNDLFICFANRTRDDFSYDEFYINADMNY